MSHPQILIVEDDLVVLKALELTLRAEGYQVLGVRDANAAMAALKEQAPDLLILDLTLIYDSSLSGILDGFSLLGWIRYTLGDANFPIIIHTSDTSPAVDRHARECKVFAVIRKGIGHQELINTVRRALGQNPEALPIPPKPPP